MNSHWSAGAFRSTSNSDYGKFMYATNKIPMPQCGHVSSNGDRVVQHLHYPNCPHRHEATNQGTQNASGTGAMPEYTIQYGEEAVRKALGGNYPDFQAQFQKQCGNGSGDANCGPQTMTGDGQKIAMVPVIFVNEDENGEGTGQSNTQPAQEQNPQNSGKGEGKPNATEAMGAGNTVPSSNAAVSSSTTSVQPTQAYEPRPENLLNAFDSVRKQRSTNYGGRHIRPSYCRLPNPCRKKVNTGDESMSKTSEQDNSKMNQPQTSMKNSAMGDMPMMGSNNGTYEQLMMMSNQGAQEEHKYASPPPLPQQPQRTRSLPPKPRPKLCMRCKKCKNLDLQPSAITFFDSAIGAVKQSPSQPLNPHRRQLAMNSSSTHLSAKNFRDIRFASTKE